MLCPRSNLLLEGELFCCRQGSLGLLRIPDVGWYAFWESHHGDNLCHGTPLSPLQLQETAEARRRVTPWGRMLSIFASVSWQPSYQRCLRVVSFVSFKTPGREMPNGATLAFAFMCPKEKTSPASVEQETSTALCWRWSLLAAASALNPPSPPVVSP